MLRIVIPERELFDEKTEEFLKTKEQTLQLEHSLVSLSKWESKWHKPFLVKDEKSFDETIDYIRCMTLSKNIDPKVYSFLTEENIKEINDYCNANNIPLKKVPMKTYTDKSLNLDKFKEVCITYSLASFMTNNFIKVFKSLNSK